MKAEAWESCNTAVYFEYKLYFAARDRSGYV